MEALVEKWNSLLGMTAKIRKYDNYLVLFYESPTGVPLVMISFQERQGEWEFFNITATLSQNDIQV